MASFVMVMGCLMVFTLLIAMNAQNQPQKRVEKSKSSTVSIYPKKKKPKTKRRIARRRARRSPSRARVKGVTGQVTLGLLIGPNGEVMNVRVLDATPPGVFDQAAVDAVRTWRFEPARYRAQAVKVWAHQVVHFNLS